MSWTHDATPGPWEPYAPDENIRILDVEGRRLAETCRFPYGVYITIEMEQANAKLIATAPLLFDALAIECDRMKARKVVWNHEPACDCPSCKRHQVVEAALRAAGGREE